MATRKPGDIFTAPSGPWTGVRNTVEPFDDTPNMLTSATNCYLPDPQEASAVYGRPGFLQSAPPSGAIDGNDVYTHVDTDGTIRDFLIINHNPSPAKIYRVTGVGGALTLTDVTPTNIAIVPGNGGVANGAFMQSFGGSLIVHDGTNVPWAGSNLGSTPITATPIDYTTPIVLLSRGTPDTSVNNASFLTTTASVSGTNTALPAGTIPANKWGVYRVTFASSSIVISAGSANYTTGYNTELLAIAALPAITNSGWNVGYFTVLASASTFRANTDALAGGASGNPATTTNYYAGQGQPWVAYGEPTVYGGSLFFILRSLNGIAASTTIAWSDPNTPLVGYAQSAFDNQWTLTQTGVTPLYTIKGTNTALYYSRALSWGAISGFPGVNFRTEATHDVVSYNVGCIASKTAQLFGNYLYFADAIGRPWRFALGSAPEALWLQMRTPYEVALAGGYATPQNVAAFAWAVIEPNLNLYIVAPWNTTGAGVGDLHVFDARGGVYVGVWHVRRSNGGTSSISVGGILSDSTGLSSYLVLIGNDAGSPGLGYQWTLALPANNVWQDNGVTVDVEVTTQRFGYSVANEVNASVVRVLEGGQATPIQLTTVSTNNSPVVATVTPPSSNDGTYRAVFMLDQTPGRGIQCNVTPTTTTSQFQLFRIEVDMTVAKSGIEER